MEITGKIIQVLPEASGVSRAGNNWKKREYVLEYMDGQYAQKIMFDFFGDRADQYPLTIGQEIKLSFSIESREYNVRWYTSIRGWRAENINGTSMAQSTAPSTADAPTPSNPYDAPVLTNELEPSGPNDDLPF